MEVVFYRFLSLLVELLGAFSDCYLLLLRLGPAPHGLGGDLTHAHDQRVVRLLLQVSLILTRSQQKSVLIAVVTVMRAPLKRFFLAGGSEARLPQRVGPVDLPLFDGFSRPESFKEHLPAPVENIAYEGEVEILSRPGGESLGLKGVDGSLKLGQSTEVMLCLRLLYRFVKPRETRI